ncbi:MAG: hypothetical protein ACM3JP_02450 [Betaproteobacteria bacterium]
MPGRADERIARQLGSVSLDSPRRLPAGDVIVGLDASGGPGIDVAIGRLAGGHQYGDVLATLQRGVTTPPAWFIVELTVDVRAAAGQPGSSPCQRART